MEEENCEQHFLSTHARTQSGRYIVRLPFKANYPLNVGEILKGALSLYHKLEHRLSQRPEVSSQYQEFLAEYEFLGHMKEVDEHEISSLHVYFPYHFVLRESSKTTKLRVVFNASYKSSNGKSLNDFLMIGLKLQQDITTISLRWRQFRYVYSADIEKMFRQILIHPEDADFQRILWRSPRSSTVQHYRLLTVTYGLAAAPYLAMRVLRQLAVDEGSDFPKAVPIFEDSIYVDDTLFGADELEELSEIRRQLVALLKRGGFRLRKWAANDSESLTDIPEDQCESGDHLLAGDETLKILGLSWSSREDFFRFVLTPYEQATHTKRSVLAFIAKLYDPLGWASPVIVSAKILMQELWLSQNDWDTPIPVEFERKWIDYCNDLMYLSEIRNPRWTGRHRDNIGIELHGFADASNRAYAAIVYMRVLHSLTDVQISIIAAKTRVAPLKTVVSRD